MNSPYSRARKDVEASRVNKVLGRKSGGRVDDGTNITITINGAGKGEQEAPEGPMPMPPPPMMPPPPPMAGIGGPPPLPPGGGGPIAMKRGGRVAGGLTSAAKITGPGHKRGGKVACKDHGGSVSSVKPGPGIQLVKGGAGGGMGRLDKLRDQRAAK